MLKRTPMRALTRLLCLSAVLGLGSPSINDARAQQGLFGDADDFGAAEQAKPASQPAPISNDPLTIQLMEFAGRGNLQLASAVSSLARVGRWVEVDRLLSRASRQPLTDADLAEMAAQIDPAGFLQIKQQDLSEAARQTIDKISAAAIAAAQSPERLRQAIDDLDNPSNDAKLASARALLSGGNAAIVELVGAAVSPNPSAPRDDVLRAMLQLGGGGVDALGQLALYGTPDVRQRALQSLARISRSSHIPELVTALHAVDSTPQEVAMAGANLARLDGGPPNRQSAIAILRMDFRDRQARAKLAENDDQVTTAWLVTDDRTSVTYQPATKMAAAYRDVAGAGFRLRRVGGLSPDAVGAVLSADMAYRVLVDPDWGDPEQIEQIRQAYGLATSGSALSAAIDRSLQEGNHPAAIGLIRLIGHEAASVLDRSLLLSGGGVKSSPLVADASSPNPRVRYEAAMAVAKLAQGAPYVGSSRVMRTLSEMRSLVSRPTVLLVETRSDVIVQLETLLTDMGYTVELVGSVADAQRQVARGGDLRMVLSKTELIDLPAIEMIDLVRRIDRGRELPILFYGAESAGIESSRWSAPTLRIDRPASTAAFDELLDLVRRRQRMPPMNELDRQFYRDAATELMDDLASAG